jgi:hypothetical protein
MRPDLPTVPLEAGLSPENPPCPACGEPIFNWTLLPVDTGIAHRCEACGLGVLSRTATTEEALADFERGRRDDGWFEYLNRESLQASFTGGAWSGLGTDRAFRYCPEAIRRLVSVRDQVVRRSRWLPGTGVLTMWQSGINMFTFGHNLALGRLGRARATPAGKPWQRKLDGFITVMVALPVLIFAVPLELIGGLFRRGGAYRVQLEVL